MNSKRPKEIKTDFEYIGFKRRKIPNQNKKNWKAHKLQTLIFNSTSNRKSIRPTFNHTFGEEMKDEKFLEIIEQAMCYKSATLTEERKKGFLANFEDIDFDSFFIGNLSCIELKRDFLIDLILSKIIKFDYFKILKTKDNKVKKIDLYSLIKNNFEISSDILMLIAISPVYLTAYQEVLFSQGIEKSKEEIKEAVLDILKNIEIYQAPLYLGVCGCTIYSAKVFIREKYINTIIKGDKKVQALAAVIATLLHEIMHILLRTFHDTNNYYIFTLPKKMKSKRINDSGTMVDLKIFDGFSYVFLRDAKFILDSANYNLSIENFKSKFKDIRKETRKNKEIAKKQKYTLTKISSNEYENEPDSCNSELFNKSESDNDENIIEDSEDSELEKEKFYVGLCKFEYSRSKGDW